MPDESPDPDPLESSDVPEPLEPDSPEPDSPEPLDPDPPEPGPLESSDSPEPLEPDPPEPGPLEPEPLEAESPAVARVLARGLAAAVGVPGVVGPGGARIAHGMGGAGR